RSHDWAQEQFTPFHQLKEIDPGARESMGRILRHSKHGGGANPSFLYVGNELEGNALHTISDVLGIAIAGEEKVGGWFGE
nr:hypothetical protein [Verrucomicrobiales bacterium]